MVDAADNGWTTIPLAQLVAKVEEAFDNGQYPIFLDKTGNAATFFTYKGNLKDFFKEIMKVRKGDQEVADALEVLRRGLVLS